MIHSAWMWPRMGGGAGRGSNLKVFTFITCVSELFYSFNPADGVGTPTPKDVPTANDNWFSNIYWYSIKNSVEPLNVRSKPTRAQLLSSALTARFPETIGSLKPRSQNRVARRITLVNGPHNACTTWFAVFSEKFKRKIYDRLTENPMPI